MRQQRFQNLNDMTKVTYRGFEPRASTVRHVGYFYHGTVTYLDNLCWIQCRRRWLAAPLHKSTVTVPTGAVKTWSKESKARQPGALEDEGKTAPHAGGMGQRQNSLASLNR